jgi:hypothetical protein
VLTFKQAVFVATLSLCSVAAWAQQGVAPPKNVAPPPADLEPGVNTSAAPPSSPESEPTAAPASKPATASAPKRAHAGSGSAASPTATTGGAGANTASPGGAAADHSGNTETRSPAAAATGSSSAAGTTASSVASDASAKPGSTTTAAAPKPGAGSGKAHDSLELDTTQITGNRELPKVLYIVPWKRSDLGDLVGKPVNSLLDEVLTPVDRDVFKRQNRYYDALKPDDAKDAAGAASDPASGKH